MPEQEHIKTRPEVAAGFSPAERAVRSAGVAYAELEVTSNFSFLRGGSHPEELIAAAADSGARWIALTDLHTVAGIVRAHVAAKEAGITFLPGCRVITFDEALRHKGTKALREDAPAPLVPQCLSALVLSPLELLLYPASRPAYARMCRLLTLGKRRAEKGQCYLTLEDLLEAAGEPELLAILIPPEPALATEDFFLAAGRLHKAFAGDRLSLAARCLHDGHDHARLPRLAAMAQRLGIPLVATNNVHYHVPERRPLQDALTCIRLGCTIKEAGFALFANAERHIKGPAEMARLFAQYPHAIARTAEIAQRAAHFSLNDLKYEYPHEICPPGKTLMQHLRDLTWQGARERFGNEPRMNTDEHGSNENIRVHPCASVADLSSIPQTVRDRLEHELALIERLKYPAYFLTVYDIVRFARSQNILCQGRGAAANSAVCYCLGVTAVDPTRIELLMERFISAERNEPPDIDIDFEHERREEVIQYIYKKYGRDRAALVAEVISYRRRSAIRDVGKALGLSLDCVDRLAKSGDWWDDDIVTEQRLRELGFDPHDVTLRRAIKLAGELRGFPRHLSQHVGGFVISRGPLCEIVPIENAAMEDRTVIEWDKDDIDDMGLLKVDCLGLGMLTCIRKAIDLVNQEALRHKGTEALRENAPAPLVPQCLSASVPFCSSFSETLHGTKKYSEQAHQDLSRPGCLAEGNGTDARALSPLSALVPQCLSAFPLQFHTIPAEDPAVYDMLCKADSVGVFQVESRAQMTMLPRLKPRHYYDLVIEVAIVRPGPIQGGMVHPYLKRRNKEEEVTYPNDAIKAVLERTLGVPLFQEQAMKLVMVAAGFTAGEADQLRRAMAAWKRKGHIMERFAAKIITGMTANGYSPDYAHKVVEQIRGFSEYGFPESHAASFALLVYVSSWLKCHHPAAFAAALINSQPMGFYQPAQIIRDARDHGVIVQPVDVMFSKWNCTLEEALRHEGTKALRDGENPSLRLGMRLVTRMRETEAIAITDAVWRRRAAGRGPFPSIESLWRASGVRVATMKSLAQADAFCSMGLDRQRALWEVMKLRDEELPLFDRLCEEVLRHKGTEALGDDANAPAPLVPQCLCASVPSLPPIPPSTQVVHDYAALGLSLKAHPISFARDHLRELRVTPVGELADEKTWPHGKAIAVAGLVLVRQRPATASGILFITIEDETGVANLIVRPVIYEKFRKALRHSIALVAWGRVERQGQVVHILVRKAANLADLRPTPKHEPALQSTSRDFH